MFAEKTTVVTGGSSGLGKALARRLALKGSRIALIARDEGKLAAARDALIAELPSGGTIDIYPCDVADSRSAQQAFSALAERTGTPDMLINSAGVLREGYFERQPESVFRETMDINFFGTLHCIQAVLPYFKKQGGGRIVNICSVAGLMGVFGYTAYCASKFAVRGLTASLRAELKYQNISVHIAYPGEFDSPMLEAVNICRTPENRTLATTIPKLSADAVADQILRGIERNCYEITPGIATRVLTGFERVFPGVGRLISDLSVRRVYQGPESDNSKD